MSTGILSIEPGMSRVNQTAFNWFVKSMPDPEQKIEFSNGTGYYSDNYLVAAELKAETGSLHYVRIKKRSK